MNFLRTIAAASLAFAVSAMPAWGQQLIRDTEIEEVMRDYTDPLLVAAGLSPNDVSVHLVADPSINAFVTAGQRIFLHTGIIVEAETPNQLIGVIAHETGHISGAHLARSGDAMRAASVPVYVSMGLGLLAAFAGEGGAAGALLASSQQFGALSYLTYSRGQEASADQAAVNLLDATGQSSLGLVEFFERFRYQEVMSQARRFPYFRSHPLSSDRIAALREVVETSEFYEVRDTQEEIDRLRRIQAKIYGFLMEPRFVFWRYPESDQSLPARYARAVAYYHDARIEEARAELDTLIAEEPDNPYFQELYGQMLFESGFAEESIQYHERSVELMPAAALLRINLAVSMIATEDPRLLDEAETHLRVALDVEPSNPFAWYQLSLVHERNGDTPLAQLAIAEQSFAIGNRSRARQFATRARAELEQGTIAHFRASEIIAVSAPTEQELREQRRQRRQQPR
ncbi:MAG: M48 family metallopeptidase [Alphaproteobacteria bacterium]|nr:M48 family metallopeptidase [Alphaproteobacteria bacterium]